LYETNQEAFDFLKLCDGSRQIDSLEFERDFLDWCLQEKLLTTGRESGKRRFIMNKAPIPSLRYLELQITARCNLRCRHCYLGAARKQDLPYSRIPAVLGEFEEMQGLRLLLSGGEPLLHPDFWSINEKLPEFGFRSILLSNGALIDGSTARRLKVHEVQVSLDGIGDSHDYLRGSGSYEKAVTAIRELRSAGKDVSVATMIHSRNLDDFPKLGAFIEEMGIREWNVDLPCSTGNLLDNAEVRVPYAKAAHFLEYGFGGGLYSSSPGYACGAHLCTVTPDSRVAKCGFYADDPAGHVEEGLRNCWSRIRHIKLEELECDCQYKEECRGGCRYRASLEDNIYAVDPLQCHLRGVCSAE